MNELSSSIQHPSVLPMTQSFGHRLRQVNRLIQRNLGNRIAPLGLSLGQWYVLRTLWNQDGLTQTELAQQSGIAGPAMVLAVRSLLATGLVTRRRPAHDKRKYLITLTERGRDLEEAALRAAMDANSQALAGASPEALRACMLVLETAFNNLQESGTGPEPELDAMIEQ